MQDKIIIYADGSCFGNPGPGGWGYILEWNGHRKEGSGCDKHTTNNKMELIAAIEALKSIKRQVNTIVLYSDSQYVVKGIMEWMNGWKDRNFINVKNSDLWKQLDRLIYDKSKNFEAYWVKGHNGHTENERCDFLAKTAIKNCQ